jgi:uncharacterized protein (DUF58 family)
MRAASVQSQHAKPGTAAAATQKQLKATERALQLARKKPWRRYFRTTREGKAFIFVTAGVGLAAINTGNNLLFLIFGFMLSLIVLSGILSEIVLRKVRVSRRLPERVFAGGTCLIEIALENGKERVPSYSLEVEDLAENLPTERRCYFLKVAARSEQIAGYRRTVARRGYLRLRGFRIATRYPFGIIEKWRLLEAHAELLVYPALLREDLVQTDQRGFGTDALSMQSGPGSEVAGLRGYQSGDSARSIHWRRSAALGQLVVYERQQEANLHLTVLLDNARPENADARWDAGFERAISRAAAIVVASASKESSAEVVCRGARSPVVTPGTGPDAALKFLALLQSVPAGEARPFGAIGKDARVVQVPVVVSSQAA